MVFIFLGLEDFMMATKPTYEKLEQRVKELEQDALEHTRVEATLAPKSEKTDLSNLELNNPHLVDGKYSIRDLIDIESLRKTLEKFSAATGFTTGFLEYPSQDILIATGWRDFCTKFHRAVPESAKHCKESNIYLTKQLKKLKELNIKPCENGLVDGATPIVIKGKYIAYLATGQVLFEKPDIERFKKQAEIYGYDVDVYLEALSEVPVVSEEQFTNALSFLSELAVTIAETGLSNLELKARTKELEEEVASRKKVEEVLKESEERLKIAGGIAYDLIYEWTVSDDKLEWFGNIDASLGYDRDEIPRTIEGWVRLIHPEDLVRLKDAVEFHRTETTPISYEYKVLHKDGSWKHWSDHGVPILNNEGRPYKWIGVCSDITESKEAEEALREALEFNEQIVSESPIGISIYDATGQCISANDSIGKLIGATKEQVLKQNYNSLESWKKSGLLDKAKSATSENSKKRHEITVKSTFGKEVSLDCHLIPFTLEGQPHLLLMINDISERIRAEENLRESEQKYRELADSLPQIVFETTETGRLTFANRYAFELFGYTQNDFDKGLNAIQMLIPEDQDRAMEKILEVLGGTTLGGIEYTAMRKDGSTFPIVVHTNPIIRENESIGLRGIIIDITKQKLAELEKKTMEAQLQHAQKMESLGTLAGGIAHDFNNILSAIIGFTEISISDLERESWLFNNLQKVLNAGDRAKDLVSQILAFSRQSVLEPKPVQVKLITKEALKLLRATLPATIEIHQNLKSNSAVMADPTQIHQIIMNLCTNAGSAMQDKGGKLSVNIVDVALDSEFVDRHPDMNPGAYIKLTVSDTGHGMSPEVLNRIFDPFFTTKEKGEGTGMGLSVVHGIIKSLSGTIFVDSEPVKGSTFEVYIPAIESEAVLEPESAVPLPVGTERILFVDDEELQVDLGEQMLKSLGYNVVTKMNSFEALELFRAKPNDFDLVITDMTMPNITGDKLATEFLKIRPKIPIILCTGFSAAIDEDKAKAIGIRAFVYKPILKQDIAKAIRKVLDETK